MSGSLDSGSGHPDPGSGPARPGPAGRTSYGPAAPQAFKFCQACGKQIDARAELCPHCGVRQLGAATGSGKDRLVAAAFAILVGGLGIHKFYLGKVALGVLYLLLSWTGIPSLIGWIEGITYLSRSNEAWAAEYGGPVQVPNGAAIGCLWLVALLPLLAIVSIISLIFLGGQVERILSTVGTSV